MSKSVSEINWHIPSHKEEETICRNFLGYEKNKHSSKHYTLFLTSQIIENTYGQETGTVTDRVYTQISCNSLEWLRDFWTKNILAQSFDSTVWHFIWDNKEDKLVETLSICC